MANLKTRVTAEGLQELRASIIARAHLASRRQVFSSVLNILSTAKRLAPIDEGRLRNSIAFALEEGGLMGLVGSNLLYAPYVEFGTGIFAIGGDGRKTPWVYFDEKLKRYVWTRGNRPQPYLTPAFQEEEPRFRTSLIAQMRRLGLEAA